MSYLYGSSWYLEGGTFQEDGRTYILQSTASSNRASSMEAAFPYNHMEVWCQHGDAVSASNPMTTKAYLISSVLDFFTPRMAGVSWEGFNSMEAVMQHLQIEYSRSICGYSLRVAGLNPKY